MIETIIWLIMMLIIQVRSISTYCQFILEDPVKRIPLAFLDFVESDWVQTLLGEPGMVLMVLFMALLALDALCEDLVESHQDWLTNPNMLQLHAFTHAFVLTYLCEGHVMMAIYGIFLPAMGIALVDYRYLKATFAERLWFSVGLSCAFVVLFEIVAEGTPFGNLFWMPVPPHPEFDTNPLVSYHGLHWFFWYHTVTAFSLALAYYPLEHDRLGIWIEDNKPVVDLIYGTLVVCSGLLMVAHCAMPPALIFMVSWHLALIRRHGQNYSYKEFHRIG